MMRDTSHGKGIDNISDFIYFLGEECLIKVKGVYVL